MTTSTTKQQAEMQRAAVSPPERLAGTLDSILSRTVDWVKFAEAKNGILLTVNAAAAAAAVGWLSVGGGPAGWLRPAISLGLGLLISSVIVALASFLPVLDFDFLRLKRKHGKLDSLLFFGSIAGCTGESYLESLRSALEVPIGSVGRLERDYALQIVINAQIATAKFRMFKYAGWMSLAAVSIPAGRVLLRLGF